MNVCLFPNESNITQLGSVVTTQIAREIQREGTFRLSSADECAIEVQGTIKETDSSAVAYARRTGDRNREYRLRASAVVSFIDKRAGKVLVNDRRYTASTTFLSGDDILTNERDASGRIAEDFARQIVDDLLSLKWDEQEEVQDNE